MAVAGTAETALARQLASSDAQVRNRALRKVERMLCQREPAPLSPKGMRRVWRALYYTLWFADTPSAINWTLERLCSWLGLAVDNWLYFEVMWETICRYWIEIDHLRLDKYYALLNRSLSAATSLCVDQVDHWRRLTGIVERVVFEPLVGTSADLDLEAAPAALGMALHVCDKWLELVLCQAPGGLESLTLDTDSTHPVDIAVQPFLRLYLAPMERASATQQRNRKVLMRRAFERLWEPLVRAPAAVPNQRDQLVYLSQPEHRQQLAERLFKLASRVEVPPYGRRFMYGCVRRLHTAVITSAAATAAAAAAAGPLFNDFDARIRKPRQRRRRRRQQRRRR
jgi:hypothetical protein